MVMGGYSQVNEDSGIVTISGLQPQSLNHTYQHTLLPPNYACFRGSKKEPTCGWTLNICYPTALQTKDTALSHISMLLQHQSSFGFLAVASHANGTH